MEARNAKKLYQNIKYVQPDASIVMTMDLGLLICDEQNAPIYIE